eukprot:636006-Ditylum_brightwellii.AAC.1
MDMKTQTPPPGLNIEALQKFTLISTTKQPDIKHKAAPKSKDSKLDTTKSATTTITITTTETSDEDIMTATDTHTAPNNSNLQNKHHDPKPAKLPTSSEAAQLEHRRVQLCKPMVMLKAANATSFPGKT